VRLGEELIHDREHQGQLRLALRCLRHREGGVHLVLLQASRVLLDACPPQPRHRGRPVAVKAVNGVGFRSGVLLRNVDVLIELPKEVCLPRLQARGPAPAALPVPSATKYRIKRVSAKKVCSLHARHSGRRRCSAGFCRWTWDTCSRDGWEAPCQAGQARQTLEAVQQPQTSNRPGRRGHLLQGPEVIALEELDERLQRRTPQAMGPAGGVKARDLAPASDRTRTPCTAAPATPAGIGSLRHLPCVVNDQRPHMRPWTFTCLWGVLKEKEHTSKSQIAHGQDQFTVTGHAGASNTSGNKITDIYI